MSEHSPKILASEEKATNALLLISVHMITEVISHIL